MPLYPQSPARQWLDQEPSVVESPIERGLRTAAKWLMPDEVESAGQPLPVGPAAPLISMFRNKGMREAATQAFLTAAEKMGLPNLTEAAGHFASKYPRVAAHTNLVEEPFTGTFAAKAKPLYPAQVPDQVDVELSHLGRQAVSDPVWGLANAKDLLHHEGTHVAQQLGNKDLGHLYALANKAVGYNRNPFEISAYNAGEAAGLGLPRPKHPYNATEGLRQLANDPDVPTQASSQIGAWEASNAQRGIQEIFYERAKRAKDAERRFNWSQVEEPKLPRLGDKLPWEQP